MNTAPRLIASALALAGILLFVTVTGACAEQESPLFPGDRATPTSTPTMDELVQAAVHATATPTPVPLPTSVPVALPTATQVPTARSYAAAHLHSGTNGHCRSYAAAHFHSGTNGHCRSGGTNT